MERIKGFIRDLSTGILINKNKDELFAVKEKQKNLKEARDTKNEIAWLKNEVIELRKLIEKIADGITD